MRSVSQSRVAAASSASRTTLSTRVFDHTSLERCRYAVTRESSQGRSLFQAGNVGALGGNGSRDPVGGPLSLRRRVDRKERRPSDWRSPSSTEKGHSDPRSGTSPPSKGGSITVWLIIHRKTLASLTLSGDL
jgi:hypothetical protein